MLEFLISRDFLRIFASFYRYEHITHNILYMSYDVGNDSRHTPSGVPEMLDTPPSHMTSTKNKFFAIAESFFYTQKTASLPRDCKFSNSKFLFQIFFFLVVHHLVFQPQHRKCLLQIFFCIFFRLYFCHIPAKLVGPDILPI